MKTNALFKRQLITQLIITACHSLVISGLILIPNIEKSRILAAVLPITLFFIAVYSIAQSLTNPTYPKYIFKYVFSEPARKTLLQTIAYIAICVGLVGVCTPSYHFGQYDGYYVRVQPLLLWVGLLGFQLLILILYPVWIKIYKQLNKSFIKNRNLIRLSYWIFIGFILVWFFISITGLGVLEKEDYWYEAGVPILPLQILLSVAIGILFGRTEKSLTKYHPLKLDLFIFFGIWLAGAIFWAITPAPTSYFNPKPLPPNYEVYPYSDAGGYDLESQSALIGLGLDSGSPLDNPMYPAFLVFIHRITGQDYTANMALQAAMFAVFPAIVYFIGKLLFGSALGVTTAAMLIFRGYNSIVTASIINTGSPKQMLTDFPTAIGVCLSILTLLISYRKNPEKTYDPMWHGLTIGFAFLIRSTALTLLLIHPFLILFQKFSFKKNLRIIFLTIAGFCIFLLPWGIRNSVVGANPISVYLNKLDLVVSKRLSEPKDPKISQPAKNGANTEIITNAQTSPQQEIHFLTTSIAISHHFLHNLITSTLVLPTSIVFDDLMHTIKYSNSVWQPTWEKLEIGQAIILALSLAVLAVGIVVLWQHNQIIGIIPLITFLFYHLANSAGRTSGGRYIVPVDWIIILYFLTGLIWISKILFQLQFPKPVKAFQVPGPRKNDLLIAFCLTLFLGAIPNLAEIPFSDNKLSFKTETFPASSEFQDILSESSYTRTEVINFLKEKNSILVSGQAMYPKYFSYRAIAGYTEGGEQHIEFPHLEFHLISDKKPQSIVLYKLSSIELSNVTNVLVLGCKNKQGHVDAIVIVIEKPVKSIHLRDSNTTLECPILQPVCDKNGNCY